MDLHWKVMRPDGSNFSYYSGFDLFYVCHLALKEAMPEGHSFVGLLPVATTVPHRYDLFGVTAEGGLINTGFWATDEDSGWSVRG